MRATGCKIVITGLAMLLWLPVSLLLSMSIWAADFQVTDSELEKCLLNIAESKQWLQPDEFTSIKCHGKGVKSLRGLEQFTQLETLSLYNNKLQHVDMDLTQLKHLKMLNLARNNLASLTIVDAPRLEVVYAFSNRIKTLQLTNLAQLNMLKVNNNTIETFSYLDIPLLSKIYIFNNQLETINIHELPALRYMDCRENPMPDELYDEMDRKEAITFLHDGNAEDW